MSVRALIIRLVPLAGWCLTACPDGRPANYYDPPRVPGLAAAADAGVVPVVIASPDVRDPSPDSVVADPADVEPGASVVDTGDAAGATRPVSTPGPVVHIDEVPSFVSLFKALSPSVVNIYTQEVVQRRVFDGGRFGMPVEQQGTSLGSGFILDGTGHIITNAHVVENAAEIRVRFHDDEEMPARLIGLDPVRDVAVLKVDGAADLRPVVPAPGGSLAVGDWVVAIGNPFGLSHTITKGIVSGIGRAEFINDRVGYLDLIQTDAAINQGNSGGPLFDVYGRIVGVSTAVNADGVGIGFAIPWKTVEEAVPRLMQGGQVSRSWLGVYIIPGDDGRDGVLVDAVVDDSPAARAGLRPGDVITALDGHPVSDVAEFRLRIASAVAGRDIDVGVQRDGARLNLRASLEEARDIR